MKIKTIGLIASLAFMGLGHTALAGGDSEVGGAAVSAKQRACLAMLKPGHPDTYVVQSGDTLWDISASFLNDPWLWPEIWHVNPQVGNPHLIYPGDVLSLVYIDGCPRLVNKLSPHARLVSEGDAIDAIPLSEIQPFLVGAQIVSEDEYNKAPYILGNSDGKRLFGEDDTVYVKGVSDNSVINYSAFRKGKAFVDPVTEEFLGWEAIHLAETKIQSWETLSPFKITESKQEVRAGDRVLPSYQQNTKPYFYPDAPDHEVSGLILSAYGDRVQYIGRYDVVVINLGERDGIEQGHVLTISRPGSVVKDQIATDAQKKEGNFFSDFKDAIVGEDVVTVKLPDEDVGHLMVFRTFEKVSLALVMKSSKNIKINDIVRTPK